MIITLGTWAEIQPILKTTHRAYLAALNILQARGAEFLPDFAAIEKAYRRLEAESARRAALEDAAREQAA